MKKVLSSLMATALLVVLTLVAGPANAQLQALGAVNPANGYPFWYQDTNGLALSLCLDRNGFCLLDPLANPIPADRADINPTNFPPEAFYYMADTSGVSPLGVISLTLYEAAVEAGFVAAVADGGQVAFTRIRIRAEVTVPGTYTVTHPYGESTYTVTAIENGPEINDTVDVPGLVLFPFDQNHPSLAGTPPTLPQDVGPFLTNANGTFVTDPISGNKYIGLLGAPVAVTGSPTGNNFVRITGGGDTLQLNTFSLMGKILGLEVTPQTGADFGVWKVLAPSTTATFTVTNRTGADIPARDVLTGDGLNMLSSIPVFTIVADDTCADGLTALAPLNTCTFGVVFTPTADAVSSGTISLISTASPTVTIPVTGTGDSIVPTLSFDNGQATITLFSNTLSTSISGTATDNVGVPTVQGVLGAASLGITPATNGIWSLVVPALASNTSNTVLVTATDSAQPVPGNQATATATIIHDSILPVVAVTSPATGLSNVSAPALTFNVTETNPVVNIVKVDGTAVTPAPTTLGPLADGQHSVIVDSTDAAGNLGTTTRTFTVDTLAPAITVTSPNIVNERLGQTNPALTITVNDANPVPANTVVTLDGVDVTANAAIGPFTAGSAHTLVVNATDGAGNPTTTTLPFTIVLADGRIISLGADPASIADALTALRHAVQLTTLAGDQFAHADVAPLDANGVPNPNGTVDIADALLILRRVVNLVTTF